MLTRDPILPDGRINHNMGPEKFKFFLLRYKPKLYPNLFPELPYLLKLLK